MPELHLAGTFTALVTPFTPDGEALDLDALDALVEAQIAGGVDVLVPCGTTGEAPTLSEDEAATVIRRVVAVASGRVPVLAGTGSFSTRKTIAASRAALSAGADGVMLVMPYYSKPSQDGLREHVLAVARAIPAPIVLYNVPSRTVVDLTADTTEQICAAAPNVVGLKDATGNVLRCQELVRRLGDRLAILCGDDALTLPMMASGARGVISVTSNVLPREVSDVPRLVAAGEFAAARARHLALLDVHASMFLEPNPAPAKAALAWLGRMNHAVRLPLVPASAETQAKTAQALERLGVAPPGSSTGSSAS
ncbi:4-hydroxy-tetrahydrodipicolinate synthase [Chondromyces apiculatus]|uniref:4-hydroxy-tetrahydrodipicolinate synthase n=1 Tax=Chondromyces apiculatus DSM 436 TaxID=1192034 RepID=A0A017T5Z1_9BACT|nr:4-hydroxy-tetrahydrodipicolinate synthase [Chondromyces apiculatus]EYF04001.1 Dihydrodipicolinate synthase [Chondromyces apiculatus DSM 436]